MENPCYVSDALNFQPILDEQPSMSSDGQTIDLRIYMEECTQCGTVRAADVSFLNNFYKNYYKLNVSNIDPQYIYNGVSMSKSEMHYEWISKLVGSNLLNSESIIEIGCGSGNLLKLFTCKNKYGVEPSKEAAKHAAEIAIVRNIGFEDISENEKYDLILSTCVIEHTINPNDFLQKKWSIAKDNALIIVGLPIQDAESFDVYFLDHLHHFTAKQFIHLCEKNGFVVEKYEVGYKCMTTIGYFLLRKKKVHLKELNFEKNQNFYTSRRWIQNVDSFIDKHRKEKITAFGFGETSFFYQTYTKLNEVVDCYIDDVKANTTENVISVQDAIVSKRIDNSYLVLLANPHYHEFLKKKFEQVQNLKFYSPFTNIIN